MGRRLPRQTARKSTGQRRLPDKTNNARDSNEDDSEEVRGKKAASPAAAAAPATPVHSEATRIPKKFVHTFLCQGTGKGQSAE